MRLRPPQSPLVWMAMGVVGFAVMIGGVLLSAWPWWLTLAQGATAAGCFIIGVDLDAAAGA